MTINTLSFRQRWLSARIPGRTLHFTLNRRSGEGFRLSLIPNSRRTASRIEKCFIRSLKVSCQDIKWKVFPRFVPSVRSTLLFVRNRLRVCVESRNTKNGDEAAMERQSSSARSSGLGKRLDPALKSWMDNVIIPALVREYLVEIEKRNRLATTSVLEVTSDKDGNEP